MRAVWREGIMPLLQMHDALDCSVATREQGELVARLGCEAVSLKVPMRVDLKFGRSWGDATHSWEELHGEPEKSLNRDLRIDAAASASAIKDVIDELTDTAVDDVVAELIPEARICVQCNLNPPDGSERCISTGSGNTWLHQRCDDAYLSRRMAEEGHAHDYPPPPPPPPPPQGEEPLDTPPPPRGNGHGANSDFTAENNHSRHSSDGNVHGDGGPKHGRRTAQWFYPHLDQSNYLRIDRYDLPNGERKFYQHHWNGTRWVLGVKDTYAERKIPYRLLQLKAALQANPDLELQICEGESDTDALAKLGFVATTNPGGALSWTPELTSWLRILAVRRAVIHEDNDGKAQAFKGQKRTALLVPELSSFIKLKIVRYPDVPEGEDVRWWLAHGHTKAELEARIAAAELVTAAAALESVCAADVEITALDWIWPGRFAIGKIGLLVGLPDEGKGLTFSDIMARITRGLPWPCDEGIAPLGNVILLTAEDDIADTVNPRLLAAGADLRRIEIVKQVHEAGKPRMFSLISDLEALRRKVVEIGDIRMILIDPITAYLGVGKIDSYRTTDVRAVLSPLMQLAGELHVAVLAIMHFNKKTDVTNVLLRISDSLAYGATARHAYGVIDDLDNHRKLLVKGKNNLAPRDQKTLAFDIAAREVGTDKKSGKPIVAPYIIWQPEPVDITATEALQAAAESKSPGARDRAKHFLAALLSNGPVKSEDVHDAAKANGISRSTLLRAKDDVGGVEIKKDGEVVDGERAWRWHLTTTRGSGK